MMDKTSEMESSRQGETGHRDTERGEPEQDQYRLLKRCSREQPGAFENVDGCQEPEGKVQHDRVQAAKEGAILLETLNVRVNFRRRNIWISN